MARTQMSDDSRDVDIEIIHTAYAEKVKEAFIVFADNLNAGQPEKACRERFVRALDLVKKARDLAIVSLSDPQAQAGGAETYVSQNAPAEALSAEDQAIIDHVLAGTTGSPRPAPPPTRFGRS